MEQNNLYSSALMEHVTHPDYNYPMENCSCTHDGVNPSCGDALTIHLRLKDDNTIDEVSWTGTGCAVSQASCDMMADLVQGLAFDEAKDLIDTFKAMILGTITDDDLLEEKLDEAYCLKSISHMPARVKCAQLGWRTLEEMLSQLQEQKS